MNEATESFVRLPWSLEANLYLVEIFFPVSQGSASPNGEAFEQLRADLIVTFGGVTAFSRAPADGFVNEDGAEIHDDIVVMEVLVQNLDHAWWTLLKHRLEEELSQKDILIRASSVEIL